MPVLFEPLKAVWPYLTAVIVAVWAILKFKNETARQAKIDAVAAAGRAETAADKASAAQIQMQNSASRLAAETTAQAMASLHAALDRSNHEIAALSHRVDALQTMLEDERARFRLREEQLNGEVRQLNQLVASLKRPRRRKSDTEPDD